MCLHIFEGVQKGVVNTSLGDEMTPHAETLEKSRVSVIFMPKIYVTVHDTPFRICWTRTYDLDNIELYLLIVYNVCKIYF